MRNVDVPVKYNGQTMRLVSNGENGALFRKGGIAKKLTITGGDVFAAMTFTDEDGENVKVTRTGKPCSCKGAPWNQSATKLRESL